MGWRFAKYEGLGNDFIVVGALVSPAKIVELCDRRRGIGADGILVVGPTPGHDARMEITNADGSVPEMCGNGIRCAALHLCIERGIESAELDILTDAGPRRCVVKRRGNVATVRVDMGGVRYIEDRVVDGVSLSLADAGNPHAVLFGANDDATVSSLGPRLTKHDAFPRGTNVEFAVVRDGRIDLVVWERGVGRTLACGTGACATAVVARAKGLVGRGVVTVALPGGDLDVEPGVEGTATFMTGPARLVFEGELAGESP